MIIYLSSRWLFDTAAFGFRVINKYKSRYCVWGTNIDYRLMAMESKINVFRPLLSTHYFKYNIVYIYSLFWFSSSSTSCYCCCLFAVVVIYIAHTHSAHTVNEQLMDMRGKSETKHRLTPLLCLSYFVLHCSVSHSPFPIRGWPCSTVYNVSYIALLRSQSEWFYTYMCARSRYVSVLRVYCTQTAGCGARQLKGRVYILFQTRWCILGTGEGIHLLYY